MQIPQFPECHHPIVKSLCRCTDQELLTLFQRHPERGQYFVAIFCRYSPIVYTLMRHSARSPVQAEYLFAMTWRHIFHELRGIDVREFVYPSTPATSSVGSDLANDALSAKSQPTNRSSKAQISSLQSWLINITAVCINHAKLPPVESIHYSLKDASPPLWCYLEQALNRLSPDQRFAVLMAQTFRWRESRIAAYLQAEGEAIAPPAVAQLLQSGYQQLQNLIPQDIREIYGVTDDSLFSGGDAQSSEERTEAIASDVG